MRNKKGFSLFSGCETVIILYKFDTLEHFSRIIKINLKYLLNSRIVYYYYLVYAGDVCVIRVFFYCTLKKYLISLRFYRLNYFDSNVLYCNSSVNIVKSQTA